MDYDKPVTFTILPEDSRYETASELLWDPEKGLKVKEEGSFNAELALFSVKQNAISREIEFGEEFSVTPEGPSLPTDPSFKDIHAAVYFIFDTFPPNQVEVDGEAPTLKDMGLVNAETDDYGRRIIN